MFSTQWLLRHMIRAYEDLNRIYIFGKSRLDMWKYPVHQCTSVGAGKNSLASTCALSAGCTIRQVHTPAIHDCKPWRLIATPSVQSFTAETFLCCFRLCSFFSEVLWVRNSSFPSRVTDSVCEMFLLEHWSVTGLFVMEKAGSPWLSPCWLLIFFVSTANCKFCIHNWSISCKTAAKQFCCAECLQIIIHGEPDILAHCFAASFMLEVLLWLELCEDYTFLSQIIVTLKKEKYIGLYCCT